MGSMNRRFRLGDVWRVLKANPGAPLRLIAERLQRGNVDSISNSLRRMEANGNARHEGRAWTSRWYACGDRPTDGRGSAAASLLNLAAPVEQRRKWLRLARIAKGQEPDPRPAKLRKPRQHHTGELERCWAKIAA